MKLKLCYHRFCLEVTTFPITPNKLLAFTLLLLVVGVPVPIEYKNLRQGRNGGVSESHPPPSSDTSYGVIDIALYSCTHYSLLCITARYASSSISLLGSHIFSSANNVQNLSV